ncbi:MAG: DNA mismatch repair protein MutS [Gemmatimonadetes bacterium]|nr:DNA mismatch repair protein MutS [Gemmatimonadota bacterium]
MPKTDDTPLMRQWREVKSRHRDSLVFFRVGDFYELFFGDAEEGARLLGLTLTSRNNGAAAAVPLAGVPVKALDDYLGRLVKVGRRVAICEQVEDPSEATGIVRREVVETVTPGTVLADNLLRARRNNFLVGLSPAAGGRRGLACLDVSTGELTLQVCAASGLADELGRLEPSEILLPRPCEDDADVAALATPDAGGPVRTFRDAWVFDADMAGDELRRRYRIQSLEAFGLGDGDDLLIRAAGALLAYVGEIRPGGADHVQAPRVVRAGAVMALDEMTRRNLELVEPLRAGAEGGTLLAVLDAAVTAMGGRLLRRWILNPLVAADAIWRRQDAVREMVERPELRRELRARLSEVADLERLSGKVGTGRVSPRELLGLRRSLDQLPGVRAAVAEAEAELLVERGGGLDSMDDVRDLLSRAIAEDAPAALQDGGVIRHGWSDDLDGLRELRDGARDFIASLQARERERTGIGSLKVGFNKVFGYYLEVTKANLEKVPDDYVRKQTLANAERYFTPELKEWEEKVLDAEDRIGQLEAELFGQVRRSVAAEVGRLQEAGARVAALDVLATLAEVAERRRYVRPEVHTGFEMEMAASRHPVVETMMRAEDFIPNDLALDEDGRIVILTGPNMAGKSTVLRQVGLIQLLAQMGSFVPADRARLPIADRIFTRVGASDNLARGQSTFMVEMNETAAIVHGATAASLVLLDEIGRGTSTYDGVSIAWAVTEHLHEAVGCKTVFATHYHELTQLGDLLPSVRNMNVAVKESGDDIVFLRRLEEGGADRSYGIQVARLAGLPAGVIARAKELLTELEGTHSHGGEGLGRRGRHRPASGPPPDQLSFFTVEHPVVERLRALEVERMTPMDALNLLAELRRELGRNESE